MPPIIDVVIVEAHHHCLEHIHAILRKKKIFGPWSMLHFDAHPDLACPTVPAAACFRPREIHSDNGEKNLYELLDATSSGIAEWILPLVLAAQLSKIEWIRPVFSNQLPRGHHHFQVGAHDAAVQNPMSFLDLSPQACLKVDFNHPYYLDDDSVVPSQELNLAKSLDLYVTQLEQNSIPLQFSKILDESTSPAYPWTLDICLDYFACWNPFLSDIDGIDPELTAAFLCVMKESNCFLYQAPCADNPPLKQEAVQYQADVQKFRNLLKEALLTDNTVEQYYILALDKLSCYYATPEICENLVCTLKTKIQQSGGNALQHTLDAIPFWNMPHAPTSMQQDQIRDSLRTVESAVQDFLQSRRYHHSSESSSSTPLLITIARSTCDGFTPVQAVEHIQAQVLNMLHRLFCEHCSDGNCSLHITKDYGEWEGSTIT